MIRNFSSKETTAKIALNICLTAILVKVTAHALNVFLLNFLLKIQFVMLVKSSMITVRPVLLEATARPASKTPLILSKANALIALTSTLTVFIVWLGRAALDVSIIRILWIKHLECVLFVSKKYPTAPFVSQKPNASSVRMPAFSYNKTSALHVWNLTIYV